MMRPFLLTAIAATVLSAAPVLAADTKEESCGYQADVVAAIQQARRDRVREKDVVEHIASTNPPWPENYSNAVPLIAPWVYEKKQKIIKNEDLAAAWMELCLQQ